MWRRSWVTPSSCRSNGWPNRTSGQDRNLPLAQRHQAIIDRFGRYLDRNALLGRESTPEELAFLNEPGSRF